MKFYFYILLGVFLLHGCSAKQKTAKISKEKKGLVYPTWFLKPQGKEEFFIGYSESYWLEKNSVEYATNDALKNYSFFKAVTINGERLTANSSFLKGSQSYHQEMPLFDYSNLKITPLKTFKFDNNFFLLGGFKETTDFDSSLMEISLKIPSEIENLQDSDKTLFAVGTGNYENYSREFVAWLEAERNSRIKLAEKIKGKLSNLNKTTNGYTESFISTKVEEVSLKNIRVLRRWKDIKNKICYVLVQMDI